MNSPEEINRRFGAITFRDKPLLVIPGGEMLLHSHSTEDFLRGLSKDDSTKSTRVDVLHGATFHHVRIKKANIIEVTDHEINELLSDERLSPNFISEAQDLLNQEPVRPIKNW